MKHLMIAAFVAAWLAMTIAPTSAGSIGRHENPSGASGNGTNTTGASGNGRNGSGAIGNG